MDISVAAFVASVAGAALVGLIASALFAIHRARKRDAECAETLGQAETDLETAQTAATREKERSDELRQVLSQKDAELESVREQLASAHQQMSDQHSDSAIVKRELSELRSRFRNIVGLEAEIATLRVIAAKVPALEARLATHEPADPAVVDLRENRREVAE